MVIKVTQSRYKINVEKNLLAKFTQYESTAHKDAVADMKTNEFGRDI